MQIAFYAPLKPPTHATPSGDRLMARQIIAALEGHQVTLQSDLRARLADPEDHAAWARLQSDATAERARIKASWARKPDLWLTYHPYYKSPDLLGPTLCAAAGVPYVTVECSWSARRNLGIWADMQAGVLAGLRQAALNICLTARDRQGLADAAPEARTAMLPPFIDTAPFAAPPQAEPGHLVTVAMMRPGDKLESYRALAAALPLVAGPWHLTVIGDGPARPEVAALLAPLAPRVTFAGALDRAGVAAALSRAALYLWPGVNEAYGLAYLEAQAAGLPVVATRTAGVPEVVEEGHSGFLTPPCDAPAFARAVTRLLANPDLRARMAAAARLRVASQHSMQAATARLGALLKDIA